MGLWYVIHIKTGLSFLQCSRPTYHVPMPCRIYDRRKLKNILWLDIQIFVFGQV